MTVTEQSSSDPSREERDETRAIAALRTSRIAIIVSVVLALTTGTLSLLGALVWSPAITQDRLDRTALENLRAALVAYQLQLAEFHGVLNGYSRSGHASEPSTSIANAIAELAPSASRVIGTDGAVLTLGSRVTAIRTCLTKVASQSQLLSGYLGSQPSWGQVEGKIESALPSMSASERLRQGNVDAQTDRAGEAITALDSALLTLAAGQSPNVVRCPHLHLRQ